MKGKSIIYPNAYVRGDFARVRIGRYCDIGEGTLIRPPFDPHAYIDTKEKIDKSKNAVDAKSRNKSTPSGFLPLLIGSHTHIGSNCVIEASSIGSRVSIGDNCVIGQRAVIKDCCRIESGTVIPDGMNIPPFSIVRGIPGRILLDHTLPESWVVEMVDDSVQVFENFVTNQTE